MLGMFCEFKQPIPSLTMKSYLPLLVLAIICVLIAQNNKATDQAHLAARAGMFFVVFASVYLATRQKQRKGSGDDF